MNDMRILGNLTKDPVIRNTNNGKTVASFSVAMNRDYVTPQGEKKQLTDYVNVVVWGGSGNRSTAETYEREKSLR